MKILRNLAAVSAFVVLSFAILLAQESTKPDDAEAARGAAMKKLDFLIGDWQGKGWIMMGRERKEFTINESVRPKIGGKIIVVEGIGKSIVEKTGAEKIIHNAYGVFSYDHASGGIRFRYFKEDGQAGETAIEFEEKSFIWAFDVPENKVSVRFKEILTESGNWLETGEVTRDGGANWYKFFEMELTKVK